MRIRGQRGLGLSHEPQVWGVCSASRTFYITKKEGKQRPSGGGMGGQVVDESEE